MLFKAMKALARSHSITFSRDLLKLGSPEPLQGEASVAWWCGDGRPVHYRRGTSDVSLAYQVLFKRGRRNEYWLPEGLDAKLILDIGANIGVVSRYLAYRFPHATLHCFEPIPGNYRMLERNLEGARATVHPYGLGAKSGKFKFDVPPGWQSNPGSFSLARSMTPSGAAVEAEVRAVGEVLPALGGAAIDLIKIDVEGAERDILDAFPDEVLARTTWIYGELHHDLAMNPRQAFGLLERLAGWFDIEMHKRLRRRNWFFDACNRKVSERFKNFRRLH